MKRRAILYLVILVCLIAGISRPAFALPRSQGDQVIAFVGINVIPMDSERVLENYTVVVQDGQITAVGPSGEIDIPEGAGVIDGQGKYLIPGLADMHTHTDTFTDPGHLTLYPAHGVTTIRAFNVPPEHAGWRDQISAGQLFGPTMLASGQSLMGLPYLGGGMAVAIRALVWVAVAIPLILLFVLVWLGLRLFGEVGASKKFRRRVGPWWLVGAVALGLLVVVFKIIPIQVVMKPFAPSFATFVDSPAEARRVVNQQQEDGVDFVKPYDGLTADVLMTVLETAEEQQTYTSAHLPDNPDTLDLEQIFSAGLDEVAHTFEYGAYFAIDDDSSSLYLLERRPLDMSKMDEIADLAARYDIAASSTLLVLDLITQRNQGDRVAWYEARPEYTLLPASTYNRWLERDSRTSMAESMGGMDSMLTYLEDTFIPWEMAFTKALHERGVPIVVGTDVSVEGVVPGVSVHQELERLVESGLTPFEALAAGTREAALVAGNMGAESNWGTIEEGNRADLVLLTANPLDGIANTQEIEGVMLRGRWLPAVEIDQMLADLVAAYENDAQGE